MPSPSLIPRYNWDFRARDLLTAACASVLKRRSSHPAVDETFGNDALLTTSGRASLVAILRALGLPKGSRVAVPLYCCPVVFEAIAFAGCIPVFVDVNESDNCLSADDLQRKLDGISAVIAVHMFGHPADMQALRRAAQGLPLIEDCAHSLFSEYRGTPTGTLGDAAFFSFRNGKYLSSGEGSVVLSGNPAVRGRIAESIASFKEWGIARGVLHACVSFGKSCGYRRPLYGLAGFRLGRSLDASLNLSAKSGIDLRAISHGYLRLIERRLRTFREKIEQQRSNSLILMDVVREGRIALPKEADGVRSNFYQFGVRLNNGRERDDLAEFLFRRGIDAARYLDDVVQVATQHYGYSGGCPVSEHLASTLLIIPNHYSLSLKTIRKIAGSINRWSELPSVHAAR